ncbi:hypothetical protein AAFN60_18545 [Roseibacillus persicicus]|uniref:hypothetical protein n=1 Tax=Roseibacillus persicicus TaxID=454148 RepID=UPI00398A58C4
MTIQKIIGENGPQDELCNGGSCPAAVVADDGNIYVQGYLPSPEAAATLIAPIGESFVGIPMDVAKKIAAQVSAL